MADDTTQVQGDEAMRSILLIAGGLAAFLIFDPAAARGG
jgi:hypothetical protein